MKYALAALTLAGAFTLAGAVPAIATIQAQGVGPRVDSTIVGSSDPVASLSAGAGKAAVTRGLSGLDDPATAMGIVLWSLAGGGALVAGATSVAVVRRRAKTDAA